MDSDATIGVVHARCPECGRFCSIQGAMVRFRYDSWGDFALDGIEGVECPDHGPFDDESAFEWYWLDPETGDVV